MIDFNAFKAYLDERRNNIKYFIKQNELIGSDEIKKLIVLYKDYDKYEIDKCFEKTNQGSSNFLIETECEYCKTMLKKEISKSKLIDYLKQGKNQFRHEHICDNCKIKMKINEEKNRNEYWENRENEKNENTDNFIKIFFDINIKWNKENNEKLNTLFYSDIDRDRIECFVKKTFSNKTQYKIFLQTPYWKHIAYKKRQEAGFKCELCGSDKDLNVHHQNDYKILGREIKNIKYLKLLCNICHQKHHETLLYSET